MIPFILDRVVCIYSIYFLSSEVVVKYTPDQIRKMEEFILVRKASEPVELIKLVRLRLALRSFVCSMYCETDLFQENYFWFKNRFWALRL